MPIRSYFDGVGSVLLYNMFTYINRDNARKRMARIGSAFNGHAQDRFSLSNDYLHRLAVRRLPALLCKSITIASFITHTFPFQTYDSNDISGKLRAPS